MIKRDLVRAVWAEMNNNLNLSVSQDEAKVLVESILSLIQDTVAGGEDVTIAGFGKIYPYTRRATRKTHPQDPSIVINVPAKPAVKFRAYTDFVRTLAENAS